MVDSSAQSWWGSGLGCRRVVGCAAGAGAGVDEEVQLQNLPTELDKDLVLESGAVWPFVTGT